MFVVSDSPSALAPSSPTRLSEHMTHITIERADLENWAMALKIAHDQIVDPEYAPIGWSVSRLAENFSAMQQALAQPTNAIMKQELIEMWHKVWPDPGAFVRASAKDLERFAKLVEEKVTKAEQERCCDIIFANCGSDYVVQRTVDAIKEKK